MVASRLGFAYVRSGKIAEGLSLLERVVAAQQDTLLRAGVTGQTYVLILLGEAYLLTGRVAEAQQTVQHGLRLARELHERGMEAQALQVLGEVASHADALGVPEAESCYQNALTLAQELRMRPLIAHCHLGLSKLYRRTGKREQAQKHLTTATTMYREMGMRFCLEQAEAEMGQSA